MDSGRSIDVAKTASIDMMSLNNKVVNMRPVVKRSKAQIVNRLCRHISALKKKKGTDAQKEKNIRKAERLIEEIESIRRLKEDKVSKYSLANMTSFESVSKSTLSPNMRALARLADHHLVKEVVNDFRQKHSDWRDLAAFLLVKQTGRKFKTKKQKQKKLAQRVENINASETMTKAYIEERFGKEGLEKAEQRFQKKRKKGKGVSVDSKETNISEMKKEQDTNACSDREDMQTDNTISPDNKANKTVSEIENPDEDFVSVKGVHRNIREDVIANEKEKTSSLDSKDEVIVRSTDHEKNTQKSRSKLKRSKKENNSEGDKGSEEENDEGDQKKDGDSEVDDSNDGETQEENDKSDEKEDEDNKEEVQASDESEEDSVDTDDSNETDKSDVIEERDEDSESSEERIPKKDASTSSTKPKIPSKEKSTKSGECVVKKLKIGTSSDESDDDDEEEEKEEEISEEDSEDSSMEEESNSVPSEEENDDSESQKPHKKRKVQKQDKSKKNKSLPEFLTKRDQVLKNTPNDPFFVGSDGEEGDDDGDVIRNTKMDFDDVNYDDFDGRGPGSSKQTSKSMFYEPGEVNLTGRRFEKKDFSSGFRSSGRGRFEHKGRGRSFEKTRSDFRGRGRGGFSNYSNRGRGREAKDDGERKVFKFGSGPSRGGKRGAFSIRGSTQWAQGEKQTSPQYQRFGSPSSKDSGPVSASADKLHPSWEASRKRKAEQSSLKAFEGTKIVFDDD